MFLFSPDSYVFVEPEKDAVFFQPWPDPKLLSGRCAFLKENCVCVELISIHTALPVPQVKTHSVSAGVQNET